MLTKEIYLAYPNSVDFDRFKVNSVNHGTIFKGNIDSVKCYTIKKLLDWKMASMFS